MLKYINSPDEPIRIAHIMGKFLAGGVESVVFNYYREIDKTKFQFDFYYDDDSTVEPSQELVDMGARFYRVPPYQKLPLYIKTLRKYFKENKYHIVHSHLNTLSVFPLYAAWRCRIPVRIAHNHSVPAGKEFKRNILKYFLRNVSKVFSTHYFACSEKAGRWLFGNRTFDKKKVLVIKNAVDINKFRLDEQEKAKLVEQYKLQDKFVIGHVGRFTYAKNHKFLLEVFAEVCKKEKRAVLMLVGDGELRKEILTQIGRLGIQDKVIFVGQVSNPEIYYCLFDVVVLPSVFEGLSLTTIESQMSGTPIIISEAVPSEAIVSNGCCYLKITETAETWAEETIEFSKTKVVLDDRSDAYDITKSVKILEKCYEEI